MTVDRYRGSSNATKGTRWAREPGGRLRLPGDEDRRAARTDLAIGLLILAAAILVLCFAR